MEEDVAAGRAQEYKAKFFVQEDHPYYKDNEILDSREAKPIKFRFIKGDGKDGGPKGYWERRLDGDWSDMPSLWGPFPKK